MGKLTRSPDLSSVSKRGALYKEFPPAVRARYDSDAEAHIKQRQDQIAAKCVEHLVKQAALRETVHQQMLDKSKPNRVSSVRFNEKDIEHMCDMLRRPRYHGANLMAAAVGNLAAPVAPERELQKAINAKSRNLHRRTDRFQSGFAMRVWTGSCLRGSHCARRAIHHLHSTC